MKKNILSVILVIALVFSCATPVFASLNGDVDGNSAITASDARIALRAAVGLEVLSASQIKSADADKDGKISSNDARLILRASVGLEKLGETQDKETDETEHTHSYKVKEITANPTCTENGKQTLICSCGDEKTETTDKLGHDFKLTSEEAPACNKWGKKIFTCSRCGFTETEFTSKTDHNYQITDKRPAKCETGGHIEYTCTYCSDVIKDTFPATGHDYDGTTGLCKNCGNSDPDHYDKIPEGGKWIVENNWEISIDKVKNHPLDSDSINASHNYTNEQCVMITYKVKNIGYESPYENTANGLFVSPLQFTVYDKDGKTATLYACKHMEYPTAAINGFTTIGTVPVVLMNRSQEITFAVTLTDSDGVTRRAIFTAAVTE